MGRPMAGHLLSAGYRLFVFDVDPSKSRLLTESGAVGCSSSAEVAEVAEVIITIVGYPREVEALYFGADGLIAKASPGSILIDMTTSHPDLVIRIDRAVRSRGLQALDAPVSGGHIGAAEATLAIMVGGEEPVYRAVQPNLRKMGTVVAYMGFAGCGQHAKIVNQIASAAGMIGVAEALGYAHRAGLDPLSVVHCLERTAAGSWSLSHLATRYLRGDKTTGFSISHFLKDLDIALHSARDFGISLPGTELTRDLYCHLFREWGGDRAMQAIIGIYLPKRFSCAPHYSRIGRS